MIGQIFRNYGCVHVNFCSILIFFFADEWSTKFKNHSCFIFTKAMNQNDGKEQTKNHATPSKRGRPKKDTTQPAASSCEASVERLFYLRYKSDISTRFQSKNSTKHLRYSLPLFLLSSSLSTSVVAKDSLWKPCNSPQYSSIMSQYIGLA